MRKTPQETYTEKELRTFSVEQGKVCWKDASSSVNLVVVINRYREDLVFAQGFMSGDRIVHGAFCSTYAHDHHNILLIGDNEDDMHIALSWVLNKQGGMCTASQGSLTAEVALPIGGILSEKPIPILAKSVQAIQQELHRLGITHPNPIMSLCTITLPVSPELKITDKGLVEVSSGSLIPLIQRMLC